MKSKLINLLLILSSLLGYLEWGGDNHSFLFQAEAAILAHFISEPSALLHPFIILPLIGQVLLLLTLFQKQPNKWISLISIVGIGLLLGFMLIIGLLSLNFKIILSTLPFLSLAVVGIQHYRQRSN